jgi:hypothetical protein
MALDADKNCVFMGLTDVKIAKMSLDEAFSINDAGGLLYSRTDCYMSVNISEIRVTTIRSNLI